MKLIPIQGKNLIDKWGHFIEGAEKAIRYSKGSETIENLYNDILAGRAILWAGFKDQQYCGFVATQVINVPLTEPVLQIRSMYTVKPLTDEEYHQGFTVLDEYCKKMKIKKMEFYTMRDSAFERKLKNHRWNQKQVVYEREVV